MNMFQFGFFLALICVAASLPPPYGYNGFHSFGTPRLLARPRPETTWGESANKTSTTVQCSRFQTSTLMMTPDFSGFNASIIDVMKPLASENVNCSNQCLTFICHVNDNITYGGGCFKDFNEICRERTFYWMQPSANESCSKIENSFVSYQCKEDLCNDIPKQSEGLMRCMINVLVESYDFLIGESLFNFVPFNKRPANNIGTNPFPDTTTTTTTPIPTVQTIKPLKVNTTTSTTVKPSSPTKTTDSVLPSDSTESTTVTTTTTKSTASKTELKTFSMILSGFLLALYY